MKYNVAISVVNDDLWIAKEFYYLLEGFSIPTFFYEESRDIKGILLKNLEKIYKNSILDIVIVSHEYLTSKSKYIEIEKKVFLKKYKSKKTFPIIVIYNCNDLSNYNDEFSALIKSFHFFELRKYGFKKIVEHILDSLMNNHYLFRDNFCPLYHPFGVKNRITIDYVKFEINKNFKEDKLKKWKILGDVLVELKNYKLNKFCYLIPSGRVPPFLSNSIFLKTNKTALKLKKLLVESFLKENKNNELFGVLIFITDNNNYYPYVYCDEFDNFFIQNYLKYLSNILKK